MQERGCAVLEAYLAIRAIARWIDPELEKSLG
jgi:hypothetical protein